MRTGPVEDVRIGALIAVEGLSEHAQVPRSRRKLLRLRPLNSRAKLRIWTNRREAVPAGSGAPFTGFKSTPAAWGTHCSLALRSTTRTASDSESISWLTARVPSGRGWEKTLPTTSGRPR